MPLVNQTSASPTNKVAAGTVAAAVLAILSWADDRFFNDYVPGYVEAAFITLGTFAAGYLVKNRVSDAPPAPGEPDAGAGALDVLLIVAVVLLIVVLLGFLFGGL